MTEALPLLNDSEAAKRLGVSPATLRSWRCRGIGPCFIKMGAGCLIRESVNSTMPGCLHMLVIVCQEV
jgi:hypothetical protein